MNKNCYLCNSSKIRKRKGSVRDNSSIDVLECANCGLVFLSSFDHVNKDYYSDAHMNDDPLGKRLPVEYQMDEKRRINFCRKSIMGKRVLDIGCGFGDFIKNCSEKAREVCGVDPDLRSTEMIRKKGFRIFGKVQEIPKLRRFDIITMFHVLEHLMDPVEELVRLRTRLDDDGKLIVEVPNSDEALLTLYNNRGFSKFYWSCHLFLFNETTLKTVLKKAGYKVEAIRQIQRYPLSNHLYWLSKNKPGGHLHWNFIDSKRMNDEYAKKLSALGKCDTLMATAVKGDING
jgi:2-polyprenyl-3-methyl-5-hydroxy-6-metoxy-1,4-benzoquinol methylase